MAEGTGRGRLLGRRGFVAGGAGALVASLFGRTGNARAADQEPLILGQANEATRPTTLVRAKSADVKPGPVLAAFTSDAPSTVTMTAEIGLSGGTRSGIGVLGVTGRGADAAIVTATAGLVGVAPDAVGVQGSSIAGHGVVGASESGIGVIAMRGVQAETPLGVTATAFYSSGGKGHGAVVVSSGEAAVVASSASAIDPCAVPAAKLRTGLLGVAGVPDIAGSTGSTAGVRGFASDPGTTAIVAEHEAGGPALEVNGRASFSSAGMGQIAEKADMAFVPFPGITDRSVVIVTLNGDPGQSEVSWVERQEARGFVVHMSRPVRRLTPFSYLVLEPAPAPAKQQ